MGFLCFMLSVLHLNQNLGCSGALKTVEMFMNLSSWFMRANIQRYSDMIIK